MLNLCAVCKPILHKGIYFCLLPCIYCKMYSDEKLSILASSWENLVFVVGKNVITNVAFVDIHTPINSHLSKEN